MKESFIYLFRIFIFCLISLDSRQLTAQGHDAKTQNIKTLPKYEQYTDFSKKQKNKKHTAKFTRIVHLPQCPLKQNSLTHLLKCNYGKCCPNSLWQAILEDWNYHRESLSEVVLVMGQQVSCLGLSAGEHNERPHCPAASCPSHSPEAPAIIELLCSCTA